MKSTVETRNDRRVAAAIWLCSGDSRTMDLAEALVRAMTMGDGEWKGKPWLHTLTSRVIGKGNKGKAWQMCTAFWSDNDMAQTVAHSCRL